MAMDIIRKEYKIYTLERELVLAMFGVAIQNKDDESAEAFTDLVRRLIHEENDKEWDIADYHWMKSHMWFYCNAKKLPGDLIGHSKPNFVRF